MQAWKRGVDVIGIAPVSIQGGVSAYIYIYIYGGYDAAALRGGVALL